MDLHEEGRVETHIVEITLTEGYTTKDDLNIIDTLLKTNIENLEQVLRVRAIIPAECLGFGSHDHQERQDPWLAVVGPKYLEIPIKAHPYRYIDENPEINSMMMKIKEEKKTVYMIILTHEGSLENPVEYFEELPLYPDWVKQTKLLFTWTVKGIMMEENELTQKSLIRAQFIQSKRYPGYIMNLAYSAICSCDCCLRDMSCSIRQNHIIPVNGCSLPMTRSPLQEVTALKQSTLELWEVMFKFAWKEINKDNDTGNDTELTYESESSELDDEQNEHDTDDSEDLDNSDDWWPDL